jgi:putative redox protein
MITKSKLSWSGGMSFVAEVDGHKITLDADPQFGGKDKGPRPKPLLLAALNGCMAMDLVSFMEKMHVGDFDLNMDSEADSTTEHPKTYHTIRVAVRFSGTDLPADKIAKAMNLSLEKYCGVYAMLKKAADIHYSLFINELEVSL